MKRWKLVIWAPELGMRTYLFDATREEAHQAVDTLYKRIPRLVHSLHPYI